MSFGDTNTARLIFGVVVSLMFIAVISALLFLPIPEANRSAVDILLGALAATMSLVYGFYFGSSEGSKNKTDLMNDVIKESQKTVHDIVPPFDNHDDLEEVATLYGVDDNETYLTNREKP